MSDKNPPSEDRRRCPYDPNAPPPSPPEHHASPFARFKTFVDSLGDNLINFPSNVASLKARMQAERAAHEAEERDISYTWTGSTDSADYIRMNVTRASPAEQEKILDATELLLKTAWEHSKHLPARKVVELYRDNEFKPGWLDHFANPMLSFGGACYYKAETVDNLPSTAMWARHGLAPQWLSVEWFKRSPYSPVRLGDEMAPFRSDWVSDDEVWRAAFEELICATLDRPMNSTERVGVRAPFGTGQSTHDGPGLDWMLSLQCRGILPLQLPGLYRHDQRYPYGAGTLFGEWCSFHARGRQTISDEVALTKEIAIKAGPRTEREPISSPGPAINTIVREEMGEALGASYGSKMPGWFVPDTEEELYAQMFGARDNEAYDEEDDDDEDEDIPKHDECRFAPPPPPHPSESDNDADNMRTFESYLHTARRPVENDGLKSPEQFFQDLESVDPRLRQDLLQDYTRAMQELSERNRALAEQSQQSLSSGSSNNEDYMRTFHPLVDTAMKVLQDDDRDRVQQLLKDLGATDARVLQDVLRDLQQGHGRRLQEIAKSFDARARAEETPSYTLKAEHTKSEKPNILSQLTTTQTTRSPDGTVTTKVVLKQRFADGTEREQESVQTSFEEVQKPAPPKRERKGGWFWS